MALNLVIAESDVGVILSGLEVGACEYTKMANSMTNFPENIREMWREKAGNISRVIEILSKEKGEGK